MFVRLKTDHFGRALQVQLNYNFACKSLPLYLDLNCVVWMIRTSLNVIVLV
jgi:hypothetical protein